VSLKGFRTALIENVLMDAGVPTTVNANLEVGSVAETIEVTGAQELVQTDSATLDSTLQRRQMTELPTITRGGLDMLISMPGIQTAGVDRNSTINGLPNGSLSIGLNWNNINHSAPYIAPQLAPGQFGYRVYVYGPWQNHFDTSLMKSVRFAHEKANLQIRASCLDCLNLTNFQLPSSINPSSGSLGQTTSAYSDIFERPGSRRAGDRIHRAHQLLSCGTGW